MLDFLEIFAGARADGRREATALRTAARAVGVALIVIFFFATVSLLR